MHNGPRIPGEKRNGSYSGKHDALSKNDLLHQLFGDLVEEIKSAFLTLDHVTFTALIADYRKVYGDKAADYAEKTYSDWKTGNVRLSGQTMQRLLEQVPPYLSSEVKYSVLVKLVRQCNLAVSTEKFVIDSQSPAKGVESLRTVLRHTKSESAIQALPARLHEASLWLGAKDATFAKALLAKADSEVHGNLRRQAQAQLIKLIDSILHKTARNPSYTISLPGLIVNVILERERQRDTMTATPIPQTTQFAAREIIKPIAFYIAALCLPTIFSELLFGTIARSPVLLGLLFLTSLCMALGTTKYVYTQYELITRLSIPKTLVATSLFAVVVSWVSLISNLVLTTPLGLEERTLAVRDVSSCTKRCQGYPYHAKLFVGGAIGATGVRLGAEANDKLVLVRGHFGKHIVNIKSISRVSQQK